MKTLGLIGGMSWESTATYYRLLNEHAKAATGGLHSARLVLVSVDFAEVEALQACGDWDAATARGPRLPPAGGGRCRRRRAVYQHHAQGGPGLQAATDLRFLHIGDLHRLVGLPASIVSACWAPATPWSGLLPRPAGSWASSSLVPEADATVPPSTASSTTNCASATSAASRHGLPRHHRPAGRGRLPGGAAAEIPLLVSAGDTSLPLFDTTALHARCAADLPLAEGQA